MYRNDRKRAQLSAFARNSIAVASAAVVAVMIAAAQDLNSAIPRALEGTSAIVPPNFGGSLSPSVKAISGQISDVVSSGLTGGGNFAEGQETRSGGSQRITLEQVKQQSANRVAAPMAHLNQLSIEAAKQHRLGVQADYFPKFGATFLNIHTTDFLGQIIQVRRPLMGTLVQVPVAI